jgi:threonine synthase
MNPFVSSLAALAVAAPALVAAQSPPVKPGLWEVRSERQDGKQTASSAEAMKNLTPETRAKVEAMMKQQGVAIGSGGANRVCLSKESLDAGRWQGSANCKTEFGSRSASGWKWHSVCPQTDTTIDGEAVFADAENYTVRTATTRTFRGDTKVTRTTLQAKWLGSDCGDLKPFEPKR